MPALEPDGPRELAATVDVTAPAGMPTLRLRSSGPGTRPSTALVHVPGDRQLTVSTASVRTGENSLFRVDAIGLGEHHRDDYALSAPEIAAALGGMAERQNTTLVAVATDAPLSKSEAAGLAVSAHAGLARAVRPSHTPFDGDTARRIVEQSLGRGIDDAYADFDTVPLASASIAQVHYATLHSGEEVVVKIQRQAALLQSGKKILPIFRHHACGERLRFLHHRQRALSACRQIPL